MPYPECPANFFFCFRLRVKELFIHFLKLGLELQTLRSLLFQPYSEIVEIPSLAVQLNIKRKMVSFTNRSNL